MPEYAKNATVARARAIYGKRLTEDDYKELVSKKSVSEVAEYLKKNTHYADALSSINTATIHRGLLESLLRRFSFDRYIKICSFQQLGKERFYNYLIVNSEMRELLSAVLHMNAGSSEEYITSMPSYLISKTKVDLIELAKVRTFPEMLKLIRHTPYYQVLKDVVPDENGKVDYLKCELALRTFYLKWMMNVVREDFGKSTRDVLIRQIEMQIDLINIINAYRMKKYYNLSSDEILKNLLPFNGRLSLKKQREIIEAPTVEGFLHQFTRTIYGRQLENEDDKYFEWNMTKLRGQTARRSLMFSENSAVSIFSLNYLFDIEVQNITNIIEGIRYNRQPAYILNMIIPV
ncbi:MAG: V-type ATPase subunit [Oscillospiraceae bacterium]|nr:V-type ATPase subunit [Oscillospiraceae bacterium]